MVKFTCPVCAYRDLKFPPRNFQICPCCGTEFGYDDAGVSYPEIRKAWLMRGAQWFSKRTSPPAGWDPIQQLLAGGLNYRVSVSGQKTVVAAGVANEKLQIRRADSADCMEEAIAV